jgi:hypothetical protein
MGMPAQEVADLKAVLEDRNKIQERERKRVERSR